MSVINVLFWINLTVDVEDPASVWAVSSIVSVGKGNLSRQGMLGNAEDCETYFSLELQGHHSWERTGGFLTCLDWKHTTSVRQEEEGDRVCVWLDVCSTEAKLGAGLVRPLSHWSPACRWWSVHQILQCFLMRDVQTWFASDGTVELHNKIRNYMVKQFCWWDHS